MFRQGQLAVHGLAILLGRNEAGISNRGEIFLHHAVRICYDSTGFSSQLREMLCENSSRLSLAYRHNHAT